MALEPVAVSPDAYVPAKDGRHTAIGRLGDGTIAVVFATLGTEGVSVISMRPASERERSLLCPDST